MDCRKEELWSLQQKESHQYMKFCLKSFSPQTETAPGETIHRNFLPVCTEPACHHFFQNNTPLGLSEDVTRLFASSESDHHTLVVGLALLAGLMPPNWAGLLKGAATQVGPKRMGSEPGIAI